MTPKLNLDPSSSPRPGTCWQRGRVQPVVELARAHTTVAVERATLRTGRHRRARPGWNPMGEPARRRGRR